MRCFFMMVSIAWTILFGKSGTASDGNLAQYPPMQIDISIRTADDGSPKLEPRTPRDSVANRQILPT